MKSKLDHPLVVAGLGLTALIAEAVAVSRERRAPVPATPSPAAEHGEGRDAERPSQLPRRAWLAIGKRVAKQISDHRLMTEAAGVTFFSLLAIFPALAALISLYGLFADPRTVSDQLAGLNGVMPGGGMDIIKAQVQALTSSTPKALGFGVLFGLATSLWSANQGVKALFDSLNVVNDEREKRGFMVRTALTLGFTAGGLLFIVLAMTAVVVLPVVLAYVGLSDSGEFLLRAARWPLLLCAVGLFLALIYRYGPSRTKPKWRWVSWGSAFASITWVLASAGFSWYVANFGSYNKTYGSLGAVVGFMTWIWISTIIVLVGDELNVEMEHQTSRDTTAGPDKPQGSRGSTKADQVA